MHYGWFGWLLPLLIVDLILRGMALYKSANRSQKYWFVALFLVNSLGILPLVYLLIHHQNTPAKKTR